MISYSWGCAKNFYRWVALTMKKRNENLRSVVQESIMVSTDKSVSSKKNLGCSDHEEEERELKVCGAREHHGFNGQKCEQQKEFLRQARQYILCAYFKIWKDLDKLTTR